MVLIALVGLTIRRVYQVERGLFSPGFKLSGIDLSTKSIFCATTNLAVGSSFSSIILTGTTFGVSTFGVSVLEFSAETPATSGSSSAPGFTSDAVVSDVTVFVFVSGNANAIGLPKYSTTKVVFLPSKDPSRAMIPISVKRGLSTLALWVGESSQAFSTLDDSLKSIARFSPAYTKL